MSLVLDKELTFKTVFRYRHIYPMAIDAVATGKVDLQGIVTDVFTLDEAQKAMDYSVNNKAVDFFYSFVICSQTLIYENSPPGSRKRWISYR